MIVSIDEFNQFTTNYEDSAAAVSMKTDMLKAAEGIVVQYLGYDPQLATRQDVLSGFGFNYVCTDAQPITTVTSISIGGTAHDVDEVVARGSIVKLKSGVFPVGDENVEVTYTAGYSSTTMPAEIKTTVLRIAGLMLQESGGNIGLSGRSFGDTSRSFVSYTNYNAYLRNVDPYRTAIR